MMGGLSSPFGGIPRNWKRPKPTSLYASNYTVPPSGGSLEIGNPDGSQLLANST